MAVKPIPEGYHSVTPYLIMDDAARALEFYKKALGAVELMRFPAPGGRIGHAEIKIGDSPVMLADESPEQGQKSLRTIGGSPISLMVYVEDVDARVAQAVAAGAKITRPVANQFYGDRTGPTRSRAASRRWKPPRIDAWPTPRSPPCSRIPRSGVAANARPSRRPCLRVSRSSTPCSRVAAGRPAL